MLKLILKLTTEFAGNKVKKIESQKGCFKKANHAKFSEKLNCLFFGFSENLACFLSLKPPFWDSRFGVITDELCKTSSDNQ